nr:MAG TPA: hypothetical protein [Caudoviricetes sp.]
MRLFIVSPPFKYIYSIALFANYVNKKRQKISQKGLTLLTE